MLKLVTTGEEASRPSSGTAPRKDSTSKKRKRTIMEDEEMYRKLRDGKPVERNTRQQNELVQLQKGMYLFVCSLLFFKPYTHFFLFFFFKIVEVEPICYRWPDWHREISDDNQRHHRVFTKSWEVLPSILRAFEASAT